MALPRPGLQGARTSETLVINDPAIRRLFLPGGDVFRWGNSIGREMVAEAKVLAAPHTKTGRLVAGIKSSTTPSGNKSITIGLRSEAKHSLFVILGTRPHDIYPNRKNALVFFWEARGKKYTGFHINDHRFRPIDHPGYAGDNFLDDAKDNVLSAHGII